MMKYDWRVVEINRLEDMVTLVSSATPTIKRFGAPTPIDRCEVVDDHLLLYCKDGVVWSIKIEDGSRRKLPKPQLI